MPSKLNLGCGDIILDGYLNVDKYNPKAQLEVDILKEFPFNGDTFEEIIFSHVIEHLPWAKHISVLEEIYRVMKPGGVLKVGFPDFILCAKAFIDNRAGQRWKWWVQTLYGSQTCPGQFHVAPVTTEHLSQQLMEVGFGDIEVDTVDCDVLITCTKKKPLPWY